MSGNEDEAPPVRSESVFSQTLIGEGLELIEGDGESPTEMQIHDVRVPGIYEVDAKEPGMTGEFMAEQGGGDESAYTGDRDDEEEQTYPLGTLLRDNGDPYLDESGNTIRIADDRLKDQTYPLPADQDGAIITEDNEVVTSSGEPISTQEGQPLVVARDGYRISEGPEAETEAEDEESGGGGPDDIDNTSDSDDSAEEEDDSGGGRTFTPGVGGPSMGDGPHPDIVPEGLDAEEMPSVEMTVYAYCDDETYDELDALRERDRPFPVGVGEYTYDRMGIVDLSRTVRGEHREGVNDVQIRLEQHREVVVVLPTAGSGGRTGGETDGDIPVRGGTGPVKGWVDENNDFEHDVTGEAIPRFEEIEVGAGETYEYSLSDGELYGNKLIDVSASGATAQIRAEADGWVVKNVGIRGRLAGDNSDGVAQQTIVASVGSNGGVIENVYIGDGSEVSGGTAYTGGIYVQSGHSDTLQINRVNIQGMASNGIYGSGAGSSGGPVEVTNAFLSDNNVASLRLGSPGSFGENVVINATDGAPSASTGHNPRGVWQWYVDNIEVRNSQINAPGSGPAAVGGKDGGSLVVRDSQMSGGQKGPVSIEGGGSSPELYVPSGVPTSAGDAASRPD